MVVVLVKPEEVRMAAATVKSVRIVKHRFHPLLAN